MRSVITAIVLVLLAASAVFAQPGNLVGEWMGKFRCRWKEGRTIFPYSNPQSFMYLSQTGDELHIAMDGSGYDGRIYAFQGDPDRGTIGAEGCLNDGNALGGFDDVVQMKFKKHRDTYLARGTLTTAGSLGGPGRCSFMFKRINTIDLNIPDCNAR